MRRVSFLSQLPRRSSSITPSAFEGGLPALSMERRFLRTQVVVQPDSGVYDMYRRWSPSKKELLSAMGIAEACVDATNKELNRLRKIQDAVELSGRGSLAAQMTKNAIVLNERTKETTEDLLDNMRILLESKHRDRVMQALENVKPFFDPENNEVILSKIEPKYAIWL